MREEIEIDTPIGKITATILPDTEYVGIALLYESDGQPGAIMEYDPENKCVQLRIYGADDPDGDPVSVIKISK